MKAAAKISLWAFALTLAFFGLSAAFMKMGPCGPASGSSVVFFVVLLPALFVVDRFAGLDSFLAWSIIALWIYALSWAASAISFWAVRWIRKR